jgi:hypothetical protein
MWPLRRAALCVTTGLATMSCAAVWGFDDAVLEGDAGAREAAARDADPREATLGRDAAVPDAGAADASVVPRADAAIVPSADAAHDTSKPTPEAATPPPTCAPACGPGTECERAVGGASVCVDSTGTCTDGSQCHPSACCVWLDYDSATGRCEAIGLPTGMTGPSCLCTGDGQGMLKLSCETCAAPTSEPGAPVRVCAAQ